MVANLAGQVRKAGVVGAGGAGFPTYVKLQSEVGTYILNGAECEPLLYKDRELMRLHASPVLRGLRLAMEATGAEQGVLAVKRKYEDAIEALHGHAAGLDFHFFGNFYPAGDEYEIVYEVTGRLIPPGGIPLQVDCVVNNVETLLNVARAADGDPVVDKWITVAGAVHQPASFAVPVGITIREAIALAGGATVDRPAVIDGGAMMGPAVLDLRQPVTKTTGGYIVLPRDHKLIRRKTQSEGTNVSISRSACDQCSYCTELCPRFLLGYAVEPHKVMRSAGFAGDRANDWNRFGMLCCECSLCSLYSCPEDLPPKEMWVRSKRMIAERGTRLEPPQGLGHIHPMRSSRRVPVPRLTHRLGLSEWDVPARMIDANYTPSEVCVMLKQHIGAPAEPTVSEGTRVTRGQTVGVAPPDKLGTDVHASIDGTVSRVDETSVWISR